MNLCIVPLFSLFVFFRYDLPIHSLGELESACFSIGEAKTRQEKHIKKTDLQIPDFEKRNSPIAKKYLVTDFMIKKTVKMYAVDRGNMFGSDFFTLCRSIFFYEYE